MNLRLAEAEPATGLWVSIAGSFFYPENLPLRIPIQEAESGSQRGRHWLRAARSDLSSLILLTRCINTFIFVPRSADLSGFFAVWHYCHCAVKASSPIPLLHLQNFSRFQR